jgi:inhibitor of KinA
LVKEITYRPFGRKAILIEWRPLISEEILTNILEFKYKIEQHKEVFFTDLIVGYNSLTIKYINEVDDFSKEAFLLKTIYNLSSQVQKQTYYLWEIPVCYDVAFGIDLVEISNKSEIKIEEIIKRHSQQIYTVFFIGFLPGFLYLGGLEEELFFERKPNPRLKVVKGAIAIGGKQTGIYPSESAGGWNIIGKTPINFFNIKNENPCFAKAGDTLKFKPISLAEFYQLESKIAENQYQIIKTKINMTIGLFA